jgi:hypothetical protein
MAIANTTEDKDIKSDVKELVDVVIEDRISRERTDEYREFANLKQKDLLQWKLEHDLRISYITGIHRVSKRFADKLLLVLAKYNRDEDRRLIFECMDLMVSKAKRQSNQAKKQILINRALDYSKRVSNLP